MYLAFNCLTYFLDAQFLFQLFCSPFTGKVWLSLFIVIKSCAKVMLLLFIVLVLDSYLSLFLALLILLYLFLIRSLIFHLPPVQCDHPIDHHCSSDLMHFSPVQWVFFLFILLAFDHWSDLLSYLGLCYHLYFTPSDVQILVNYYFFPLIL